MLFRDFITELPVEILESVLDFLSFEDLINCCLVCKCWNTNLTSMSAIWKNQSFKQGMYFWFFRNLGHWNHYKSGFGSNSKYRSSGVDSGGAGDARAPPEFWGFIKVAKPDFCLSEFKGQLYSEWIYKVIFPPKFKPNVTGISALPYKQGS